MIKFLTIVLLAFSIMPAGATELWIYAAGQRDTNEDVGRAAIGGEAKIPITTSIRLDAAAEFGAAVVNQARLDCKVEGGIAYNFLVTPGITLSPLFRGGYRQWYFYKPFAIRSDSAYILAGLDGEFQFAPKSAIFARAAGQYLCEPEEIMPYLEAGLHLSALKSSLFYDRQILNNGHTADVIGLKFGIDFQ